jgi:hypothetical protein
MVNSFNLMHHLVGESRYGLNSTPTAMHNGVAPDNRVVLHDRPAQGTHPWVSVRFSEPHPWNRITIIPGILPPTFRASLCCLNRSKQFIPRRCALLCTAGRTLQPVQLPIPGL